MKKLALLSLLFSFASLHSMNQETSDQNDTENAQEVRSMLSDSVTDSLKKRAKLSAKALVLQERVRRVPGYETFDILGQINTGEKNIPSEVLQAEEKISQFILSKPGYLHENFDNDMQDLIQIMGPISTYNYQLKAAIEEMEKIIGHEETIAKLEKLEAAAQNQQKWCSII